VPGFVQDIDVLSGLSADPCNLVFLSDRSLYCLQNLAGKEVNFYSRYGTILDGGRYIPVASGDANEGLAIDVINGIKGELSMGCLEDLITAINGLNGAIASSATASSCCATTGDVVQEDGERGGSVPAGFDPPDPITDRRCKASNYVWVAVDDMLAKLIASPVEEFLTLGVGAMTGLVGGLLGLAAVGAVFLSLVILGAGAVLSIVLAIVVAGVDLPAIKALWLSEAGDVVQALWESTSASDARDRVLVVLDTAGLSAVNQVVARALLPDIALNLLFFEFEGSSAEIDAQPITYPCVAPCVKFFTIPLVQGGGGTVVDLGGGVIRLTSAPGLDGRERVGVRMWWDEVTPDCCGPELTVTYLSGPTTGYDGTEGVRVWEDGPGGDCISLTQVYGASVMFVGSWSSRQVLLRKVSVPFVVDFTIT
jgi:hypothetical protein